MKRRQLVKGISAFGAAAASGTLPNPAIAKGARELSLVTTWPRDFSGLGTGAARFARRVTEMSAGSLRIKLFAGGELVPTFRTFEAVSAGQADLYHAFEYYWQAKSKAFNFFASVPFGMTATEMSAWINHGGGQELWDTLSAGYNLKPLMAGNTGVQMGGWYNKEIKRLADMRGLKVRMPGLGGEVLRRIGAKGVALPAGQILSAMKSGKIDGTEWFGPWNDLALGLHEVADYYYYPGFHEPGTTIAIAVNLDVWKGLSGEHRAILRSAAATENDVTFGEFNARNNQALETLTKRHGVKLRRFPSSVLNAVGTAAGQVVRAAGRSDAVSSKVYDSFIAFRHRSIAWSKLSDQAFWNARLLPFKYKR